MEYFFYIAVMIWILLNLLLLNIASFSINHPHFHFFFLAHEGSAGYSWNLPASSLQSTGPNSFLPGAWDQRHAPKLLRRSEDPTECTLPDGAQSSPPTTAGVRFRERDEEFWWRDRDETQRIWAGGGRHIPENGECVIVMVFLSCAMLQVFKSTKKLQKSPQTLD